MSLHKIKQGRINSVIQVFFPKFHAYLPQSDNGWTAMGWEYTMKDLVDRARCRTTWKVRPLNVYTGYVLNSSILATYYKHKYDNCSLFKSLAKITPEVAHVPTLVTRRIQKLFRLKWQRKSEECL